MSAAKQGRGLVSVLEELATDRLAHQARELMTAAGERALSAAGDKAGEMTDRLLDYVENGPGGGDGANGGGRGGGGGGKKLKLTNIVEQIEVGVPVRLAYDQWTQFQDFPKFTKRVESVEQESDEKTTWKAGIFLSHRTWQSTIVEQVPDQLIVWRSKGDKGWVDGTVTFHELAPNLTKILVVLEYHPQGLFERTGNLWRSQGRRARLELKNFQRHVMTQTLLDPDGVEGWRGEIHDGEVVRTHEDAMDEEEERQGGADRGGDEADDEADAEEDDRDEYEDDYEDDYEDESADDDDERDHDEEEDPDEAPARQPRKRRATARGR